MTKRKSSYGHDKKTGRLTRKFNGHTLKWQGASKTKTEAQKHAKRYREQGAKYVRVTPMHYEGKVVGHGVWASKR